MKKIIIDCDPGHDDMMAIMVAAASGNTELLGITTVAGNQTGEKTFLNAQKILTLLKRKDIPLARGADKPLLRKLVTAPTVHGITGLDGAELPEPDILPCKDHAVELIADLIEKQAQPLTLIPTGPLTNIALLFLINPGIKKHIERIVLMGGGVYDSNITPAAEFNIYVDPEAAKIVFESGVPITMVGLDVTNKSLLSFEEIDKIEKMRGKVSGIVGPLLRYFAEANRKIFEIGGAPIHDALAVMSVIEPSVIKTRKLNVEIETDGRLTRGRTVVDVYGVTGKEQNVDVAIEVDIKTFKEILFDTVKRLDVL